MARLKGVGKGRNDKTFIGIEITTVVSSGQFSFLCFRSLNPIVVVEVLPIFGCPRTLVFWLLNCIFNVFESLIFDLLS